MSDADPILRVRDLEKHYPITKGALNREVGRVRAVDGISFELQQGETLGIVGESGCGKSTAATAMLRVEEPTAGEVIFDGEDITTYDSQQLRRFRRRAQMIFQDPDSSFNPRMSIGDAVAEPLTVQGMTDADRRERIVGELLERVGLSSDIMNQFPHEFSGGQKQRIGLARALAVNPDLLVADEPVSALDISIQSEILKLLNEFQEELGLAVILISHNLGVVREICDRVAVMYLGEFVEVAPTDELFTNPKHPYTRALLSAIPTPDPTDRGLGVELKGTVPDPSNPPAGCRFHTRCPEVIPPSEISVPQEVWRQILQFRKQVLQDAIDLQSIAEVRAIESELSFDTDELSAEDIPEDRLASWIRREYEIPETIADSSADQTITRAIEALIQGEGDTAKQLLNEQFETVCERQKPGLQSIDYDHQVACLLHEGHGEHSTAEREPEVYSTD